MRRANRAPPIRPETRHPDGAAWPSNRGNGKPKTNNSLTNGWRVVSPTLGGTLMPAIRASLYTATALAALSLSGTAWAQTQDVPALPELAPVGPISAPTPVAPMTVSEVRTLPPEYQSLPVEPETATTIVDADGVETITRTRRIVSNTPLTNTAYAPIRQAAPVTTYSPPTYYQTTSAAPAAAPRIGTVCAASF